MLVSRSCVSSGPPGLVGGTCVDASCGGGVDPDYVADAGLGVKRDAFYSSYHGGYTVMWSDDSGLDMNAGAVVPGGGLHGWLSGGNHRRRW